MTVNIRRWTTAALAVALGGCSVTSQPQNTVLAPEQQQLGKRRIFTSATQPSAQDAVRNFVSEGTGTVPVVLIKSERQFVQHVYDTQASFDICMSLMSDRVAKSKVERDSSGRRSYYCVPVQDGAPGAPTLVAEAEG